ncbi:MAG: glycogen debranching N-terminal domain-containing protein [Dehalococcoidia bacterium]
MAAPELEEGPGWLPVGEEPHPSGSITHLTVLRHGGISVLSLPSGDIDARSEPATGLYARDTRHLSRLRFTFGGVPPILLDARRPETPFSAIFTNGALRDTAGDTVPAQTLVVRRRRAVSGRLIESLSVSNYSHAGLEVDLRIEFAADFHDIFEVRGYPRRTPAAPVRGRCEADCAVFRYLGADGVARSTTIAFSETPARLTTRDAHFVLALGPGETREFSLEVSIDTEPSGTSVAMATADVQRQQREWLAEATHIETNRDDINALLRRSLLDIHALQTTTGTDAYLAAGVPWFDTLFGRDSLIAGMELLAFAPSVLRTALLTLAKYQAEEEDAAHDAMPGKMPHELRWGELARAGEVPFGRYYGSVDGTPLFVVAAWEYLRWTSDTATLRELWPHIQSATWWCREQMAAGPRGFVAYSRVSAAGLENQGWKDSHDCIVWPDGHLVAPPIALAEVQGYVAAALASYGFIAAALGEPGSEDAAEVASDFAREVDAAFGHEHLGYVLCLDGAGEPVPTPATNAGHLLWSGTARADFARTAALRLMQPDLFSGWGLRTLASTVPGYNPLGYHKGSVWPHDNALILTGMRRYGFDDLAERLGTALIETALAFPDYCVPELFSGDAREFRAVPTPYPVASWPQAWAAASMPAVFTAMLGLQPGRPGQLRVVRPMLPGGIETLAVRNLRFAGETLDLIFRRVGRHVSVEVERQPGSIEVVLSQAYPGGAAPAP